MMKGTLTSVLVLVAVLPAITNSDPVRKKGEVSDSESITTTVGTVLLDKLLTTTDWENTLDDDEGSGTLATITTTVDPVESEDSVGISTVIVESKHFGTKNYTFLEPSHIPISDFLDLDEDMDLELLFTEAVNADFQQDGDNPAQNIVLQIEDYDDEGNTQSYFLHSSPHSEETHGNGTMAQSDRFTSSDVSSRVSGFFRDVLQRLGVYKYIVNYQNEQNRGGQQQVGGPKVPHRFHPHFINTPKGLRNIPTHFGEQFLPSETTPGSPLTSSSKRPRPGGVPPRSSIGNLFNQFKQRIKAIYPGTVWCGDGNQAKSENDIGFFHLTDTCCRAHDLCPVSIAAGEQFNRLKNNGYFTRSHCDCDKAFYNCLKNADTLVSNQIGYTYFNLLKPQCFRHEHPKVACTKKSKGKCLTYVVDETKDKLWQWFDNLIY